MILGQQVAGSAMRAALGLPRRGSTLLWHKEEERTGTKALFDPLLHATTNRVSLSCGPRSIGRDHPCHEPRVLWLRFLPEKPWGLGQRRADTRINPLLISNSIVPLR
jgi:hypothetical protein